MARPVSIARIAASSCVRSACRPRDHQRPPRRRGEYDSVGPGPGLDDSRDVRQRHAGVLPLLADPQDLDQVVDHDAPRLITRWCGGWGPRPPQPPEAARAIARTRSLERGGPVARSQRQPHLRRQQRRQHLGPAPAEARADPAPASTCEPALARCHGSAAPGTATRRAAGVRSRARRSPLGRAVVETCHVAESGAPVRPCQLRQARGRGRADGGGMLHGPRSPGLPRAPAHPAHTRPARTASRAQARRTAGQARRDSQPRSASHGSRPCRMAWASSFRPSHHSVRASEMPAHARVGPMPAQSGWRRQPQRRHDSLSSSCSASRCARPSHVDATAICAPAPARPYRDSASEKDARRRGRPSAVDVQPPAGEGCVPRFRFTAPPRLRTGRRPQQPFGGRMTPGARQALALADGAPHVGATRSRSRQ